VSGRVLVTGASGFVGTHVVEGFAATGWTVLAGSRNPPVPARRSSSPEPGRVSWVRFTPEVHEMAQALVGVDVVVHLAAAVAGSRTHPMQTAALVDGNILFGAILLEAMRGADVGTLVNASTVWKYRDGRRVAPVNRYAATKLAFEVLLDHAADEDGLTVHTLELADTYGPRDTRPKLIPQLLHAARERRLVELGAADQPVAPTHITDVVRAFVVSATTATAWDAAHDRHAVLPDRSGPPLTVGAVVDTLRSVTGGVPDVAYDRLPSPVASPDVVGSPHAPPPGWHAGITLPEGLRALWTESASS